MVYENITNKSFEPKSISDIIYFFYSVAFTSAKGEALDFEKFIDWLDENPSAITEFNVWLTDTINANNYSSNKTKQKKDKPSTPKN
jgi:hypothetical protein